MKKEITKLSDSDIKDIINLYSIEMKTTRYIGKLYNITHSFVLTILKRNNIERRDSLNCRISSGYDRDFFKKINTEEKAYFLGLLYADGNNSGKGFSISLQEEDSYLIELLRRALKAENIKIIVKFPKNKKHKIMRCLSITSVNMSNDLIKLGVIPRKSLFLKFPNSNQVPDNLIHHFIRGYFDGDGCIAVNTNKSKNGESKQVFGTINLTSSTYFSEYLKSFFKKININFHIYKRIKDKDCSTITVSNIEDLFRFYNYIYRGSTIWMTRKRTKFESYFELKKMNSDGSRLAKGESKYRGVHIKKSIWNNKLYKYIHSMIWENGKNVKIGTFKSEMEAAKAYDKKAFEIYGIRAILNFPNDYRDKLSELKNSEKSIEKEK